MKTQFYYSPDELYHYGILGMRWGIRRTPEELGHEILKNEHKQAETAMKIAKMERKHANNPSRPYRKSEARLYKQAEKLKTEHDDLEMERAVSEKYKKAQEAKAQLKKEQKEAKAAKDAHKKAQYEAAKAAKEAKEREKLNSHYLQNKPLSEMTDRELADYLNRRANEKRYAELNPKKKTWGDEVGEFMKKNSGKAAQALVDVGLDVGKDILKSEIKKEYENRQEKPNSWEKYSSKNTHELNDKDLSKWESRLKSEANIKNSLGKLSGNNSLSQSFMDLFDDMTDDEKSNFFAILNENGVL